jgi:diacylglycerol kinase family enzyme
MRHVVLIVNPLASGVIDERVAAVERELAASGVVETVPTERRGHAMELVRVASRTADALVVYSGDGGFNEALNGLERDVPIGFVPGGRSNVLPQALGLPRHALPAAAVVARALAGGKTRRISVGRVNGRRFGFSAGLGFDAELVRRVEERGRSSEGERAGDFAFAAAAARFLAERRMRFPPSLEIEGVGRAAFAFVANCDPYSYFRRLPLRVAPQARFELGLDLVAPVSPTARDWPRLLAYAVVGRGQANAPDVLYRHDADRIEIRCERPMPLQADGEDLGDVESVALACERRAVSVLV